MCAAPAGQRSGVLMFRQRSGVLAFRQRWRAEVSLIRSRSTRTHREPMGATVTAAERNRVHATQQGAMGVGANRQFEMLEGRTATWGRVHRRRLYAGTMASGQRGSLQATAPRRSKSASRKRVRSGWGEAGGVEVGRGLLSVSRARPESADSGQSKRGSGLASTEPDVKNREKRPALRIDVGWASSRAPTRTCSIYAGFPPLHRAWWRAGANGTRQQGSRLHRPTQGRSPRPHHRVGPCQVERGRQRQQGRVRKCAAVYVGGLEVGSQ